MRSVLELDVSRTNVPGVYKVQVIESPAGEASATVPMDPSGVIDSLGDFQQTVLASSVSSRKFLSRSEERVRSVGQGLFDALFAQQPLAELYRASRAVAVERGETLRMVLRLNAPELAALPWESMFDEATDGYVCRREPLVRHIPIPSSPPPLKVQLPLRILAVIASPRGLAVLDVEKEQDDLARALEKPIKQGSIVLRWLERATWPNLQDALLTDSWHVIHFIGHGDFDIERDEGVIALESEEGRVHRVAADSFVDLLREAQPMPRLVVLNACESSTSGGADMFAGTAATLVRGGVSAVTAMQFEISDKAAIAFCRGFYAAIGRGRGIDQAVRSGRVAILGLGDRSLEWITPTLYLRGRETQLFAVAQSPHPAAPEPVQEELRDQAWKASKRGDVGAVPLYDSVIAENPDDAEARRQRQLIVADARPQPPVVDAASDAGIDAAPAKKAPAKKAPATRAPAKKAPAKKAAPTKYPDRLAEIWAVTKRTGWLYRPGKDDLKVLATALRPEETIVGCVRLAFSFASAAAIVVTDRHIHFSTATNSEKWRAFVGSMPQRFRLAADHVCIPLSDVAGPPGIVDRKLVLFLLQRQGTLTLTTYSSDSNKILQEYVTHALQKWTCIGITTCVYIA